MKWLILLILMACTTTIPPDNIAPPPIPLPPLPDLSENSAETIPEVKIEVTETDFYPNEIVLKQGEKIKLVITAHQNNLTFELPVFNIDEELERAEDLKMIVTPNKKGTFGMYSGKIEGKIIIQ